MLKQIYVKDFILLDEVMLEFGAQMSAFTGETGAGKSLLMDAIGVLKGDRISAQMVKQGARKALIEGVFELKAAHPLRTYLEEQGFELEDDLMIVTREITSDGKSTARINRRLTTVSFLKETISRVIDIHSQHDTQYLLNQKYHLSLLDRYGTDEALLKQCRERYLSYKKQKDALEQALHEDYNEDDLEFLTYQLNEIDEAQVKDGELEEIETALKKLQAFEKTSAALQHSIQLLEEEDGGSARLYEAAKEISTLQEDAYFDAVSKQLYDLYYSLEDLTSQLQDYAGQMEYDEEAYNRLQERSFLVHKLYRKYGGSYAAVMEKRAQLESRIDSILHRQDFLEKHEKLVEEAYQHFYEAAKELQKVRKETALRLEESILQQLKELCLPNARFHIAIHEQQPSSSGIDKVEFLISMNQGEVLKPLSTTASGGELSRFMLGMKCVFTKLQGIDTIVFDEIDTGVSGSVAFAIGQKMRELSRQTQVFCVTHLAAVAACADQHYIVEKKQDQRGTSTFIRELMEKERIAHLAMIASNSTSPSALQAAQELLSRAQSL